MYKFQIARLVSVIFMGLLALIWIVKTVMEFTPNNAILALVWSLVFLAQWKRHKEGS